MTLVSLRPSATVSNTGALTGAASAHAALSDNSDASYVTFDPAEEAVVDLGDLTLPGGAVVKTATVKVRYSDGTFEARLASTGAVTSYLAPVGGGFTPSTLAGQAQVGWTDAHADAARISVKGITTTPVKVYEVYGDIRYVVQPVPTVTAPTGTVTNTNLPTTTWTDVLDSDGGGQTHFEVKIFSAAQYGAGGFDPATSTPTVSSGITASSALLWQATANLANATYRSYVRVAQTVNGVQHWSAWVNGQYIVNVAIPGTPTLALTPFSSAGYIQTVTTTVAGAATTDNIELQRSTDGGTTWLAVRNNEGSDGILDAEGDGTTTVLDYEAPNGTVTSYRARALHNYSGVFAASAWSTTQTATWTSTDWWIKHPNRPTLNLKLTQALLSYATVERGARNGVFQPLGATLPIVISDTRAGETGTTVLVLTTVAAQNALDTLLDQAATLLLQGPAAEGHPDRYVRFGDHSSVRQVDKSWALTTLETLPWTRVAAPPGAQS